MSSSQDVQQKVRDLLAPVTQTSPKPSISFCILLRRVKRVSNRCELGGNSQAVAMRWYPKRIKNCRLGFSNMGLDDWLTS